MYIVYLCIFIVNKYKYINWLKKFKKCKNRQYSFFCIHISENIKSKVHFRKEKRVIFEEIGLINFKWFFFTLINKIKWSFTLKNIWIIYRRVIKYCYPYISSLHTITTAKKAMIYEIYRRKIFHLNFIRVILNNFLRKMIIGRK